MDNATGIPPGSRQYLAYCVEVRSSSSLRSFGGVVYHPTSIVEAPNLPACENLTVSVTAENMFFAGSPASDGLMTVEAGW